MTMRVRLIIAIAAAVLFSFVALLMRVPVPSPEPFVSQIHRSYFPLVARAHDARKGVGLKYAGCDAVDKLGVSWFYNWGFDSDGVMCSGKSGYVDMIFGSNNVSDTIRTPIVIGFNEFTNIDQSNMSITQTVIAWRIVEVRHPNRYKVSPSAGPGRFDLWRVADLYHDVFDHYPLWDAVNLHWYDNHGGGMTLQQYVETMHAEAVKRGYRSLWLTEFAACLPQSAEGKIAKLREWLTWLSAQAYIARWAWYAGRTGDADPFDRMCASELVDGLGNLTPIGIAYRDWP